MWQEIGEVAAIPTKVKADHSSFPQKMMRLFNNIRQNSMTSMIFWKRSEKGLMESSANASARTRESSTRLKH
jgi:hypothetical protein